MVDKKYPSERQDQFIVRLPDGMRDRIRRAAEVNNRSMNAEIVATLEEKYPPAPASMAFSDLDDLGSYVLQGADGADRQARLEEVNRRISASQELAGWTLQLFSRGTHTAVAFVPPSGSPDDTSRTDLLLNEPRFKRKTKTK
ncbi:Arc family DNA-binding protein [Rubellimicrobium mesophilum]|uniref:Arc family DNA-binding protein n=1 Tax=Rubellimicrobium mesophilum TaxID=1123067 RepID=UPI0006855902|nr:Arc family DNA-binding protein [Rubellimicrobium mesophilum]